MSRRPFWSSPSSSERIVERIRRSGPLSLESRLGQSDSNSSRKITEGFVSLATPYSSLMSFEDSPKYFETTLETFTLKKTDLTPSLFVTAFEVAAARSVFPVPGGP